MLQKNSVFEKLLNTNVNSEPSLEVFNTILPTIFNIGNHSSIRKEKRLQDKRRCQKTCKIFSRIKVL